jgi:hypothetical protein
LADQVAHAVEDCLVRDLLARRVRLVSQTVEGCDIIGEIVIEPGQVQAQSEGALNTNSLDR